MYKKNLIILVSVIITAGFMWGVNNTASAAEDHNSSRSNLSRDIQKPIKKILRRSSVIQSNDNITGDNSENGNDFKKKNYRQKKEIRKTIKARKDIHIKDGVKYEKERLENHKERRRALIEKLKNRRQEVEKRVKEHRSKIGERRHKMVEAYTGRMVKRFNAINERLEKISVRITSRIDKLESDGLDLSIARGMLVDSQNKMNESREKVIEVESFIEDAILSDNPKEAFKSVRETVHETINTIKEAHRKLVESVKEIRKSIKLTKDK